MTSFHRKIKSLATVFHLFDADHLEQKIFLLTQLSKIQLVAQPVLAQYFEILVFMLAYPSRAKELVLVKKEIRRITRFIKSMPEKKRFQFDNSGLPYTPTVSKYSHHGLRWLLERSDLDITLESLGPSKIPLSDVLQMTLPSIEKSETAAGLDDLELLEVLRVPAKEQLIFLVNELSSLEAFPEVKDFFYDQLEVYTRIRPRSAAFSKAHNQLDIRTVFYHSNILKSPLPAEILHHPVSRPLALSQDQRQKAIRVVKDNMIITARETDPTTFMMESSFRLISLDRGIMIAIYEIIPERQLPLESYVGYTAFKNGLPTAYGGAWLFGDRAHFGINIFETYRGGESGYIMLQLLNVYQQWFDIHFFEVEPFQFGLDNPDGIASGAFWFYYKMGFRPMDDKLNALANEEWKKITTKKGYRTSVATLKKFTASSIGLTLGKTKSPKVTDITSRVTEMIHKRYRNNRRLAIVQSCDRFHKKAKISTQLTGSEQRVFEEISLWAESMSVKDASGIALMKEMIPFKPVDVFSYQKKLREFFYRT